jgi:hypothetical protein
MGSHLSIITSNKESQNMISHVVIFKFSDPHSPDVESVYIKLRSLAGKVPQLKRLEVGMNLVHSERAYDLALVAKFDSMQDLEAYEIHPYHKEVAQYVRSIALNIISVDYEIQN